MTPAEKDIEKHFRHMIGSLGGLCLKWVCPGWAGVPDRICLMPGGKVFFAELKRPVGGIISPRQKEWNKRLTELGFWCYYIRNLQDIADLKEVLTID